MHIPDLAGRIGRKRAEIKEVQTALRLLENQVRPERLAEQRTRIEKSGSRRDRARRELEHSRRAREGGEPLPTGGRADDRAEFEAEGQEDPRASRLPDARAVAEGARIGRLNEELRYLETLERQLSVSSPVDGLIITPRLAEKVGRYFHKGELICVVVEPSVLEGEIVLPEQKVGRVKLGQTIALKARALPYQTFQAKVDRIAPVAEPGERQSTTTVYCQFERPAAELRPGISGYARICVGRSSVGSFLVDRVMRFVRTEFWW